ncbi:MAG: hypothetical protein ABIA76_04895 [Candidatus Diapherotrites archaeon]
MGNNKGIFYSVTIMLFIVSLISFVSSLEGISFSFNSVFTDLSESNQIDSKFDLIYSSIMLDSNGSVKEVKERLMPMNYDLDENSFSLGFSLPLTSAVQALYFDYINALEISFKDQNIERFDGVFADFNSAKNSDWGGDQNSINFLLLSHCAQASFIDLNEFELNAGNCFQNRFDFNAVRRIDLNLSVMNYYSEDFNSVYCYLNGADGCVQDDFNSLDPNPFIEISFYDESCSNCILSESDKEISLHFNPAENNYIIFSCFGVECISSPIRINFSDSFSLMRSGANRISSSVKFDFNSSAESLILDDVNFSVFKQAGIQERRLIK